jgi:hypothetical protein
MCKALLCEWLLYCSGVVTRFQLCVGHRYVSGYYIVQVLSLDFSYV